MASAGSDAAVAAHMGPTPVTGTITAAQRQTILQETQCSAAVRARSQWGARMLTITGPAPKLDDAHRMALRFIEENGEDPEAAKIVNLHFPLIYIFARIYIPNLRKLKGKCKFYIFPKNVFFRRKLEDLCKNENFHFFCTLKIITFFPYSWSAPWTFEVCWQSLYPGPYSLL